jgi:hypothetical protein
MKEITRKGFFSTACLVLVGLALPLKKKPVEGCRYCPLWRQTDLVNTSGRIKDKFDLPLSLGKCMVTHDPRIDTSIYAGYTWSDSLCWWKAQETLEQQ